MTQKGNGLIGKWTHLSCLRPRALGLTCGVTRTDSRRRDMNKDAFLERKPREGKGYRAVRSLQDNWKERGKPCSIAECSESQLQADEFKSKSHRLLLCDLGQGS